MAGRVSMVYGLAGSGVARRGGTELPPLARPIVVLGRGLELGRSRTRIAFEHVRVSEEGRARVHGLAVKLPVQVHVAVWRKDRLWGGAERSCAVDRFEGPDVERRHSAGLRDAHAHEAPLLSVQHQL